MKIKPTESEEEYRCCLRLRRLRSSENQIVGVVSGRLYSERLRAGIVIDWFLRFCLRLRQSSFHWITSDLVKIENWSRKRGHKLHGIGVGRIRTVPFSSDFSAHDSDAYDPVKTTLSESQAEAQEPTNHNASSQPLRVQSSAHDSNNLVFIGS